MLQSPDLNLSDEELAMLPNQPSDSAYFRAEEDFFSEGCPNVSDHPWASHEPRSTVPPRGDGAGSRKPHTTTTQTSLDRLQVRANWAQIIGTVASIITSIISLILTLIAR